MSNSPEVERALATMREAQELVASVRRQMEEDDAEMRKAGIDPDKLLRPDAARLSAADQRKLEEEMRQDREDIEAAARQAGTQAAPGSAPSKTRRPHDMV